MDTTTTFLLYLALHRILVIGAGILAIVLGYRLLMRGLAGGAGTGQELEATLGEARLSARNLAPGSLFALFGAVIVAGMALYRPPEITLQQAQQGQSPLNTTLRGDEPARDPGAAASEALRLLTSGDRAGAAAAAIAIGRDSAPQWNNLAWVIVSTDGNRELALSLAQAAVAAQPGQAEHLHTLATVWRARGDRDAALRTLRQAAALDARFEATLRQWEAAPGGR